VTSIPWDPDHPQHDRTIEDFFDDDTDPYADISYWSKAAYWTIEEATVLSSGYEPRVVTPEWVRDCETPFKKKYEGLKSLAQRARDTGELKEPITPAAYIKWTKSIDEVFNPELEKAVHSRTRNKTSAGCEDPLHPRTKTSYLKMILAMAVGAYKFNPAQRSAIPKKIQTDVAAIGYSLSDDTIRAILTNADDEFGDKLRAAKIPVKTTGNPRP
jgi:hypothetical protein